MTKELHIYLFRHGQTYFNRDGIFTGWLDSKLTSLGIKQAQIIAKKLKDKKFDIAFFTKLTRSKQTLKEVLKYHSNIQVIEDNRMIERNYGKLNGVSHEKFIRKMGKQGYDLLKEGDAIENLSPRDRDSVEEFLGKNEYNAIHRGYDVAVPGGESFADVEKRVKSFIEDLKKFMKKNKVSVAISAHGNSIRLFRKIMEKSSKEEAIKWFIPYDKVFEYDVKV